MASFKHYIIVLLGASLLAACQSEEPMRPDLVVEGWIEPGKEPVVMLHKGYVLDMENDPNATLDSIIMNQLVIFGKVVIYDGTDSVILKGRLDTNYMPPYIYTSVYMHGEEGKTYTITAHCTGYDATATTSIPARAFFDSIQVYQVGDYMKVRGFVSSVKEEDKFIVMLRTLEESQYRLCPLGAVSGKQAQGTNLTIDIRNITQPSDDQLNDVFRFPKTDSIIYSIKLARVDDEAFRFWDAFAAHSLSQGILFMPVYQNVPTNITNGLGYWCGMGSSEYYITTDKNRTYRY